METQLPSGGIAGAFLVEGYWPAGPDAAFREATVRLEASLAAALGERAFSRAVAATLVPGDEAAYWIVDAPSREVVAQACAAAGLRVERIVNVLEVRAGIAVRPGLIHVGETAGHGPATGTVAALGGATKAGGRSDDHDGTP